MILLAISHKAVTCHTASRPVFNLVFNECFLNFLAFCTNSKDDNDKIDSLSLKLPPEPQNCCMSGCANCVWVAYAEEVAKIMNDGGEAAKKKILENVKDPNLRAFLMIELQELFKKK